MKRGRAARIVEEVRAAVREWPVFAAAANLGDEWRERIRGVHRLAIPIS
jgi:hypothetical protein